MAALDTVLANLARRGTDGRTEADIQSDVKLLLTTGGLEIEDDDLEVKLEVPSGTGRIDVEVGYTVFETKRDLRKSNVLDLAVQQLAGYVSQRAESTGARYVGIITDGHDWRLYTLAHDGTLVAAAHFELRLVEDGPGLLAWLSTILATTHHVRATAAEIDRRFGSTGPAHAMDMLALRDLWTVNAEDTELQLKKELWGKLLHTAFGEQFDGGVELFIRHTYLVIIAELIAHEVLGVDLGRYSAQDLVRGRAFRDAGVYGVVEEDFFDWPAEVVGGDRIVRAIARRVGQIDWSSIEHDLLKHLYESVISAEQRHALGEYYTPDWLAEAIIEKVVDEPATQRVADFACGSGTFLFHSVRRVLAALEADGVGNGATLEHVTSHVIGIDVHPVAVTLARVTYLLALGASRLSADRGAVSVPVYLGDSIQWQVTHSILTSKGIAIPTSDGKDLFATELFFPSSAMADPSRFEQLVVAMVDKATSRNRGAQPFPKVDPLLRGLEVSDPDKAALQTTLEILCDLHDHHRNHIWGYYVRNLARPRWLTQPEGKVDRVVGNPPWLSYRFMDRRTQEVFKERSQQRNLWSGGQVSTQQDLSSYFVTRVCELYLKEHGRFGMVMPRATLDRKAPAGFRSGQWGTAGATAFEGAWDLDAIRPRIFPVPSSVVMGTYLAHSPGQVAAPLVGATQVWSGALKHQHWSEVANEIKRDNVDAIQLGDRQSPYGTSFIQGAVIVPRVLHVVQAVPASSSLGMPVGLVSVQSDRSSLEKGVWKQLPSRGPVPVERACVRAMHLGSTLVPFRMLEPWQVVLPLDPETGDVLDLGSRRLERYPRTLAWWQESCDLWTANGKGTMTLLERIDYFGTLTAQFPAPAIRLAYTKAGTRLAAAMIFDQSAVIDHKLYWAGVDSIAEGRYLEAILNSAVTQRLVEPFQSRGNIGARDFDMYPWHLPIPRFDPTDDRHARLAALGGEAAEIAAKVDVVGVAFQAARKRVRAALIAGGVADEIDGTVSALLDVAHQDVAPNS